ncbi:MAG: hypothetical protein Pars2KO_11010 [Parasphingorhabdus sp.]
MPDKSAFDIAKESATDAARDNIYLIERFYGAIGHDMKTLCSLFTPDALYRDQPKKQAWDAIGPQGIAKKLTIMGSSGVVGIRNEVKTVVAQNHCVMTERDEEWRFETGEVGAIAITTVHKITDGKIAYWNDYYDMESAKEFVPAVWLKEVDELLAPTEL